MLLIHHPCYLSNGLLITKALLLAIAPAEQRPICAEGETLAGLGVPETGETEILV